METPDTYDEPPTKLFADASHAKAGVPAEVKQPNPSPAPKLGSTEKLPVVRTITKSGGLLNNSR
jgi:hypothetical protein